MPKLIVAIRNFENAPKNESQYKWSQAHAVVKTTITVTAISLSEIALIDKNNAMKMKKFLRINIPKFQKISPVMLKTAFPYRLIKKLYQLKKRGTHVTFAAANKAKQNKTNVFWRSTPFIPQN
jgi:hypothetical protein